MRRKKHRRISSPRALRAEQHWPWSVVFTALLFAGLLLLAGCRGTTPSPASPTPGWARPSALTALHPGQARLADLAQQIAALTAQRRRLLDAPQPSTPPAALMYRTPPLAALPSPAAARPPSAQTARLNADDLAALRRTETELQRRAHVRQERTLRQQATDELQQTLAALAAASAERRRTINENYRHRYVQLEMRWKVAGQLKDSAQQQYDQAKKNAALYPSDKRAPEIVTNARTRLTHAEQNYVEATRLFAELDTANLAELAAEDDALATARRDATAKSQTALAKRLEQEWQQRLDAVEQRVAAEEARLDALAAREVPLAPEPPLAFPEGQEGDVRVLAPDLPDAFAAGARATQDARDAAVRTLDQAIASLDQQRRDLRVQIDRDTRAAARAVAAQHGIALALAAPHHGADMTGKVQGWLTAYWNSEEHTRSRRH